MHVLIVDDERRMVELVTRYLRESGHTAIGTFDGPSGLDAARDPRLDAAVVDVMLPGFDGLQMCRMLRAEGNDLPVILLTARGAIAERVAGLDAGADDYLVKPFAMAELQARIRALSRRRPTAGGRLEVGDLVLIEAEQRVWRGPTLIDLSRREFALLQALMYNAGCVVSRGRLESIAWDGETELASNAIDVHISKLRAKIDRPFGRRSITTLRGIGYRLEKT